MATSTNAHSPLFSHSLTIAFEASLISLPPGWEERSTPDGKVFYFNIYNLTTSWDRPARVPPSDLPPAYEGVTEGQPLSSDPEPGTSSMVDLARFEKGEEAGKFTAHQNTRTQRPREVSDISIHSGRSKAIWVADYPVSPEMQEQVNNHQHDCEYIRYSALKGGPSDLLKLSYTLRPRDPTEIFIAVDMKRQSLSPSLLDELSTTSFSKDFEAWCNGSPLKGIVVCVVIHEDRLKDVPWLRHLGFGFLWDLPPVVISDAKKGEIKLYDDGQHHPRKIYGDKVMTVLTEYTTTFHLQNWQENTAGIPDITPGQAPIQIMLCSTKRGLLADHSADHWIRPISTLLDARLCLRVRGGTTVAPGSIYKHWQLFKDQARPSESSGDVSIQECLG